MFFVTDGTVVIHANGSCALKPQDHPGEADKVVGEGIVAKGDVFGEGGLFPELGPWRRESVSALTWVSAYTLNAAALRDITAEYPEVQLLQTQPPTPSLSTLSRNHTACCVLKRILCFAVSVHPILR